METQSNQAVQATQKKKGSSSSIYLYGCFVGLALMMLTFVVGIFVGRTYFPKGDGNGSTNESTTTENTTTIDDGTDPDEKFIKVTSPVEGASLNGKIMVEGEATSSLKELAIKLYDDEWNNIGTAYAGLNDTGTVINWSTNVHATSSPTTLGGKLRIFPVNEGEDSRKLQTINIQFAEQNAPGRVRLFAPLYLQTIVGETVYFKGQMRDFYQATIGIRLKNETGNVILEDKIIAVGNNIGQWAQFSKVVKLKSLPKDDVNGVWEIYEIDEEGEFTTLILTVPILYQ